MSILKGMAITYCEDVVAGREIAPPEVVIQCQWTLEELDYWQHEKDYPYFFDDEMIETVEGLLSLLNFATGIGVIGTPVIDGLHGFQAYFFCAIFGWKFKSNHDKYRYRDITLFIPRKNAKSWKAAVVLIIMQLTEDDYSEFYSICLDRGLAAEIKKAMSQIIDASPAISKYFKVPKTLSGQVLCKLTNSFYQPRTAESGKNNSIRPTVFIADEIGAFKDKANVNAMRSGQKNVTNAIQINTTTAYAEDKSVMLDELDYIRKVFNGTYKNDRMFALLYYAPKEHLYDDIGLYMSNPLRIEDNYNTIREDRKLAIDKPKDREEYLTKAMNHFVPSYSGESYINITDVRKCKVDKIDWTGRNVYIGLDLALTTDNCSYSMTALDEKTGDILGDSFAFVPADRVEEKSKVEKEDYLAHIGSGKCFSCGDLTVSYLFIEQMIMQIEEEHGVSIVKIGYDRANCLSTAQKLEDHGYECVQVRQHSDTLHPPTKLLQEYILSQKFQYEENTLLEVNFQNARVTEDTTLRKYVNKKKSNGKVDMVVSLIIAVYLLQLDEMLDADDFVVQV